MNKRALVLMISLAVAVVVIVLACSIFAIGEVRVVATTDTLLDEETTAGVIEAAGIKSGGSIFSVDEEAVISNVESAYPQIKVITVERSFPGTVSNGQVNKRMIRDIVFSDHEKLAYLEGLIHPFLKETLKQVIRRNAGCRDLFFIDIALLFEMGWDKYCDFIIVADVDYEIQKQRVMKRDKVSADDFDKINNVQMDNKKKIELADIVINTNKPKNLLRSELIKIIERLEAADGQRNCF